MRIGIKPAIEEHRVGELSDFVLDRFGKADTAIIEELLPTMEQLIDLWIHEGAEKAMNVFNRRPAPPPGDEEREDEKTRGREDE